jgi:hypothetical protein
MIALGLRIKTGFAIALVVEREGARFAARQRIVVALSTDQVPDSHQPYHPALDLPEARGAVVTERAVEAVRKIARQEMKALLTALPRLEHAALVVGSLIAPEKVANPHIRAHALEGKLFREVVSDALEGREVGVTYLLERDAYETVAAELGCTPERLRRDVDALGKGVIAPWRAEEKLAALGAYSLLQNENAGATSKVTTRNR